MPCCISLNNVVGNFSPLADESVLLKDGDLAKIDLGAHIDGFAANTANTIIIGGEDKATEKQAHAILACQHALRAAERAIKAEGTNYDVTEVMNKVTENYEVNMISGTLSHQVKKYCIDGNKTVIAKSQPNEHVDEWVFEKGEVIHLDIFVSSGEGKPKLCEHRSTIYKRQLQNMYNLKI